MKAEPIYPMTFKYHHPLKTAWLRGELPTVKYGLYGELLTPKNISLEHLKPVSKGGKTTFDNLALADKKINNKRGSEPIEKFVTIEMIRKYLRQFKDVKTVRVDGNEYIKGIKDFFKKLMEE